MSDIRGELIDIVEYYVDFISRDTKEYLVDAIEELFATENNVGCKWIPVSERLPEKMEWVMCACVDGEVNILRYDHIMDDWDLLHRPNRCYRKEYVTHWMPLPEPPKGE